VEKTKIYLTNENACKAINTESGSGKRREVGLRKEERENKKKEKENSITQV